MSDKSSGERFHEGVRRARRIVSQVREEGVIRDVEADLLDKCLDEIVQARFDDGSTHSVSSMGSVENTAQTDDPPF